MDISSLYSTRIQKTFDEDNADILAIFAANQGKSVKLINYYKGIPLSYPARVVSANRHSVDLDLQEMQAYTVEQARSTFIRSPLFKYDLLAQAQYVNVKKKAATFVTFTYVEILAERRNFIRIGVDAGVTVSIQTPGGLVDGELYDVSLSGVNVLTDFSLPLETGAEAQIKFELRSPETGQVLSFELPALFLGSSGDQAPRTNRFCISLCRQAENLLSQYIFQRQVEIIRQIKDLVL